LVNRQEHLAPTVGHNTKHCPTNKKTRKMRSKRQGPVAPNKGESVTLQQVMEIMQAFQEEVVASKANQE